MTITINDDKVCAYFEKNTHLNPNLILSMIIDLMETFHTDNNNTMSNQLLSEMMNQLRFMDNKIEKINNHNDTELKLLVSDIKTITENKSKDSVDEIVTKIKDTILTVSNPDIREKIKTDVTSLTYKIYEVVQNKDGSDSYEKIVNDYFIKFSESTQKYLHDYLGQKDEKIIDKLNNINNFVDKQNSTVGSTIGKNSEDKLEKILNESYPNSEITNTSGSSKEGDFMLKRNNVPINVSKIMFENKDYTTNVPDNQIKKFIRDIDNIKCHGIFLSQSSGIVNKEHLEIEFHGEYILLYLHNVNYSIHLITAAVQIIDKLASIDSIINADTKNISIKVLEKIKKELLLFVKNKDELLNSVKEQHKNNLRLIESMEFPNLYTILSENFADSELTNNKPHNCKWCHEPIKGGTKGTGAHNRRCAWYKKKEIKPELNINTDG